MAKYKNIGISEQTVPGVGLVQPGETVDIADAEFNNANFQLVSKSTSFKKVDEVES